jgi:4-amino-4-deoxy-L-arabinose transferase-like glycosyltransferase
VSRGRGVRFARPQLNHPEYTFALAAITLLAALLRLTALRLVALDPYYDAAVRSMGLSWHNFFYGAFDPSGRVAIDKPPVDLWLQVASVKLLGFKPFALKLPGALAASLAAPLLYDTVRRAFAPQQRLGRAAGLLAALALAVMPISVLTSRSDTMDSLMMALLVLAAWLLVLAGERAQQRWLLLAAVALGLAFNVKLLEMVVAVPALALLAWFVPGAGARRLALAALVLLAVALSWITVVSLTPAHDRPYPLGSTNGSVWNAVFVYNGIDRLTKTAQPGGYGGPGEVGVRSPAGPLRLFDYNGLDYGGLVGTLLLGALLFSGLALRLSRPPPLRSRSGAPVAALALWLLTGYLLFSFGSRLHPRYLEAFTPAVAAALGAGLASSWFALRERRSYRAATLVAVLGLVVFVVPLARDARLIHAHASDQALAPAFKAPLVSRVSAYLRAHQGAAHYEFAAAAPTLAAPVIVRDVRPILLLEGFNARTLVTIAQLRHYVDSGQVRYVLSRGFCPRPPNSQLPACSPLIAWVRAHGVDVTPQLHDPTQRAGLLYALTPRGSE